MGPRLGRAPPMTGGPKLAWPAFWCLPNPSFVDAKLEYALDTYALNIPWSFSCLIPENTQIHQNYGTLSV